MSDAATPVVLGWFVEALPDKPPKRGKPRPVVVSRVFEVKEAADQWAALYRRVAAHPDSVQVRERMGFDGV